jgi:hypothetical protein
VYPPSLCLCDARLRTFLQYLDPGSTPPENPSILLRMFPSASLETQTRASHGGGVRAREKKAVAVATCRVRRGVSSSHCESVCVQCTEVAAYKYFPSSAGIASLIYILFSENTTSKNGETCLRVVSLFPTKTNDVRAMCPGSASSVFPTPENFIKQDYMLLVPKSSLLRAHGSRASALLLKYFDMGFACK